MPKAQSDTAAAHAAARLDLPRPFDIQALCRQVANSRSTEIVVNAMPISVAGIFGLTFTSDARDYIFYDSRTSRMHRDHIILHELGHIVLGHPRSTIDSDTALTLLGIDPDTDVIRHQLARSDFDHECEQQAELFADLVAVRARLSSEGQPDEGEIIKRIGRGLGA